MAGEEVTAGLFRLNTGGAPTPQAKVGSLLHHLGRSREGGRFQDGVSVGQRVMFVNDNLPRATNQLGQLLSDGKWELVEP